MEQKLFEQLSAFPQDTDRVAYLHTAAKKSAPQMVDLQIQRYGQRMQQLLEQYSRQSAQKQKERDVLDDFGIPEIRTQQTVPVPADEKVQHRERPEKPDAPNSTVSVDSVRLDDLLDFGSMKGTGIL